METNLNNLESIKININITEKELQKIIQIVYDNFGIKLTDKKKLLIESRLSSTIKGKGLNNFTDYINYIEKAKNQIPLIELVDKISTNHTYFFRESAHFSLLDKKILPEIFKRSEDEKENEIRIWTAGCSSGEEPYTIAMIANEYMQTNNQQKIIKILATDISITVLNEAESGIYTLDKITSLPKYLKLKYLNKISPDKVQVSDKLKKMIHFKKLNLMNTMYPFKKQFDLIFCRNVMIYFDEVTRDKLVNNFSKHLKPNSYFLIGHSETIRGNKNFNYLMPATYKKI